jgi:hypothetical protein
LNTLVNFESALLGLDGQFSVGGNNAETPIDNWFAGPIADHQARDFPTYLLPFLFPVCPFQSPFWGPSAGTIVSRPY